MTELLSECFQLEELRHAKVVVGPLFARKFGVPPPDYGRHFVGFFRDARGALHTLGYVHCLISSGLALGGGSCIDEAVVRLMTREQRQLFREAGGINALILRFMCDQLSDFGVVFGYCGDARAKLVDLKVGFVETPYPRLLVKLLRPLPQDEIDRKIEAAHAFGPF